MRACIFVALASLAASPASAESHVLRIASIAPDGTGWSREMKAFAREVEAGTLGALRVKFYFGAIAGDDVQAAERIRREQLDGEASGGILCERLSPTMHALRVLGLFQSREEWIYTLGRLKPVLDDELDKAGFVNLAAGAVGPHVLFTRAPVRSLAELQRTRVWVWELDDVMRKELPLLGVETVPLPFEGAARAYDQRQVEGFVSPPTVALAFQWSAQAGYVSDLRLDYITACLLLARGAFDPLPLEQKQVLRAAAAKLRVRFEDLGRQQDDALLGGLFARQGLRPVPASDAFRREYLEATRAARERLGDELVPRPLLDRVLAIIAEYRAEHGEGRR